MTDATNGAPNVTGAGGTMVCIHLLNNGQPKPSMAVLTKPFAVDTLAARIRELIAK